MKLARLLFTAALGTALTFGVTSCKKNEGCTDPDANNYNVDAEDDDGTCTYPTVTVKAGGDDGDVVGAGGNKTSTHTWTNNNSKAELNMDLTSSKGGTFQIVVTDADGTEVLNETLTAGVGDDSLSKCSATGTPGTWTVKITLTKFNGDGSFTLSQGC